MNTEVVYIITDNQDKPLQIQDLDKSISHAHQMVDWHNEAKQDSGDGVIYFPDAHKWWEDILLKLKSIKQ